ncbi:MAG: TadE/TadG family type IV pilus assembly protein [Halocynthiibacter sp.]
MRLYLKLISQSARDFIRENRGAFTIEFILLVPVLLWAYLGTALIFDIFKARNRNMKASYTVADALARLPNDGVPRTQAQIDGLKMVFDFNVSRPSPSRLRVSVVSWSASKNRYIVHWSCGKANNGATFVKLTEPIPESMTKRFPIDANGVQFYVVETYAEYKSRFPSLLLLPDALWDKKWTNLWAIEPRGGTLSNTAGGGNILGTC